MKLFGKGKPKKSAPITRAGRIIDETQRETAARRRADEDQVAAQRRKNGKS